MRGNLWDNKLPIDIGSFGASSITGHPSTLGTRRYKNFQGYTAWTKMLGQRSVNEVKAGWFGDVLRPVRHRGFEQSPLSCCAATPSARASRCRCGSTATCGRCATTSARCSTAGACTRSMIGGDLQYNHDFYEWQNARYPVYHARGGPVPANIEELFPVWNNPSTWNLNAAVAAGGAVFPELRQVGAWTNETPQGRRVVPGQLARQLRA